MPTRIRTQGAVLRPQFTEAAKGTLGSTRSPPLQTGYSSQSTFTGGVRSQPGAPPRTLTVTDINQRDPNNDGVKDDYAPKYANGDGFCGPTSMLMAARALGFTGEGTTAEQIIALAETGGYESGKGVAADGFAAMAQALGVTLTQRGGMGAPSFIVKVDGRYQADHAWIQRELAAGRPVIINVNTGDAPGHWKVISGWTPPSYTVSDPWTGTTTAVSPATLDAEILPGNGVAFALSRPAPRGPIDVR